MTSQNLVFRPRSKDSHKSRHTVILGDKRLEFGIGYDEYAESPREWDNVGTMVCWHRRYKLGDEHSYASTFDFWKDIEEREAEGDEFIVLDLYLLDHSGITMSISPFNDPWDSGQVGFIYCSMREHCKEYIGKEFDDLTEDEKLELYGKLKDALIGEVEVYDQYLRGEIYCYYWSLEEAGVVKASDACGGFFSLESVTEELFEGMLPTMLTFLSRRDVREVLDQLMWTDDSFLDYKTIKRYYFELDQIADNTLHKRYPLIADDDALKS